MLSAEHDIFEQKFHLLSVHSLKKYRHLKGHLCIVYIKRSASGLYIKAGWTGVALFLILDDLQTIRG